MIVRPGDRVEILAGDEKGGWGIVKKVYWDVYHVGLYGSETDVREYERREVRKSRTVHQDSQAAQGMAFLDDLIQMQSD